ncbi:MAG: DUF4382 domain-containing protein [Cyclobacteriaceae bacterium]
MKNLFFISVTLLSLLFLSCENEKNAKVEVWLTDAPGDFQEVNIDLKAVEIHSSGTDNERGWQSLAITEGTINLLDLTNGRETRLGDLELPGGKISQIRLKLGDNNTIKLNDQVYPLATPSAQQSGLKLQIHQVLAEGITYKILLDCDAALSVVKTGSDTYSLKPVIRAITQAQDGAIKGEVNNPAGTQVSIAAFLNDAIEPATTTTSDDSGNFLLRGLAEGTYRLAFNVGANSPTTEKTDVTVELGVVTDVGTVDLQQ